MTYSTSLELPSEILLCVTSEQFEMLAVVNRDLKLERSSQGELIVNPPTGGETGYYNSKIVYFLVKWVQEEGGQGITFDSSTGFKLPNGAYRSPDAAWIQQKRWQSLTVQQQKGFVPLCPDFVIELRSESDNLAKLQGKMQEYLDNGAQLGWLIDPLNRRVEIYRPLTQVEILDNPSTLSGENLLPNFVLNLHKIWN